MEEKKIPKTIYLSPKMHGRLRQMYAAEMFQSRITYSDLVEKALELLWEQYKDE